MDKPATATRTYPVDVINMEGKTVKAGKPVELPIAKVEEHELRFGLKIADRISNVEVKNQSSSTGSSTTTDTKSK